ncbi:MAG TPA: asparagine synthase (glutamine-hydrolyzing) [Candidatus Krumholzibacteria bacterium]|nr:asparagine synthase (glutamine-hydrolyzing) [Candidatus Krumholzibacteria bacterium]
MCGILGYYNIDHEPVQRSRVEIEALRDMMTNRGPDASGYLESARKDWILAHRRLSIIDLSERGRQPMSTPDGTLHISYNGEIYNYRDLRDALEKRGVVFRSTSDTEVILHLYREYGTGAFQKLEGMFAIILIDERERRAVLARDPVGKKPLYYALLGRNLVMASDPGVISRDRDYRKEVSVDGLYSVLAMGGVRAPNSLFRNIYKLEPGSFVVVDDKFSAPAPPNRFFEFALKRRSQLVDDEEAALETVDHLLDRAVAKRMLSDVPFGVFLSGGIDSALIVHYMSRHTDRVNTISLDMKDSAASLREGEAATFVAERYGTNHHTIDLDTKEYIRLLDEVVLPNSTPGMTESVLLAKLSELARATGTIVIETGEGADELFMGYGGYLTYLEDGHRKLRQLRRASALLPLCARASRTFSPDTRMNRIAYWTDLFETAANATIIKDFLYEPFLNYQAERIVAKKYRARPRHNKYWELNSSITSRVDKAEDYSPAALSVLWNVSFRWAELLLTRIDNFTMSSGIEGRAPMLDIDLMNFAFSLTDRMKERPGSPKYILRQLVSRHISPEHAARPKTGFGGGGSNILNAEVRAYLASKLDASPSYRRDPLLSKESLADEFQLFTLASLHVWFDRWM